LRVAFFGSSRFSGLVLAQLLASEHEIACVVTQPDQPSGRSMTLTPTVVAVQAEGAGLPVFKPQKLRGDGDIEQQLREMQLDALLVASYGQILPRRLLDLTPWPLNVHPSDLPKLRGASPIRTALLHGLTQTACCIMCMTPRLDDGDVLLREPIDLPGNWNYERAETALGDLGGAMVTTALDGCAAGEVHPVPQDGSAATYCSTYTRDDTWINWTRGASELHDFVRAWDPDIGSLTMLKGKRLKIWRAEAAAGQGEPGTVIEVQSKALRVACGRGALSLLEVQPENKRRMGITEFMAGNRIDLGRRLTGRE
jgi:methionyl-tRNA formyltransferase